MGKVWGNGISQNVVWYVVKSCCERVGLEHIAPHDLRRTCAKLCHSSGGELEQIQFLLGHASVQTTERYLGCKQNLGHPVNDPFNLRTVVQPQEKPVESAAVEGAAAPVEKVSQQGIECRHGGSEDAPAWHSRYLSLPERTDMVEIGKGHRPQNLRRCSEPGTPRSNGENKTNGQSDQQTFGAVGFGTLPDPTT
jgi:hypothetical protein